MTRSEPRILLMVRTANGAGTLLALPVALLLGPPGRAHTKPSPALPLLSPTSL